MTFLISLYRSHPLVHTFQSDTMPPGTDQLDASSNLIGYGPNVTNNYSPKTFVRFDGQPKNYEVFETSFLSSLRLEGLHLALDKYVNERPATGFDIKKAKERIYDYLCICLDRNSVSIIRRNALDDGVKALAELKKFYLRDTNQRLHKLWRSFITCKMQENDLSSFLSGIDEVIANLSESGEKISDALKVVTVLNGLSSQFNNFVDIAVQRNPPYSFEELKIALLNQEEMFQRVGATTDDQVMFTTERKANTSRKPRKKKTFGSKWCEYHKSRTHSAQECFDKDKHKSQQVNNVLEPEVNFNVQHTRVEHEFNFHVQEEKAEMVLEDRSDLILVDSGCTSHIEKNKSMFVDLQSANTPICLADGHKATDAVKGVGATRSSVKDVNGEDVKINLHQALFIPEFKENIISVSKTVKNGHSVVFSPEGSFIHLKNGQKLNIIQRNNLFYIKRNLSSEKCAVIKDSLHHWHLKLGHCNVADLKKLPRLVEGMTISDFSDFECETCIRGKMTNPVSKTPRERATNILDLVHTDVVGPITPMSKEKFRYSINFVDDSSGLVRVYLLKQKCDAHLALMKFIADVAVYGKVKRIRCDNGTEYTSQNFRNVCLQNNIGMEFSSPRSPHQNGVAERNHRTIYEMARCLLQEANLPQNLWPYAVKTAAHIRNRCVNSRTGVTPCESFRGRRPNMSTMQIFGAKCLAYDSEAGKLDSKCKEGIFVGHDPESPAFLIYFPLSQSVRRERNVRFLHSVPVPETITLYPDPLQAEPPRASKTSEPSENTVVPPPPPPPPKEFQDEELPPPEETPMVRRSQRESKPPAYLND